MKILYVHHSGFFGGASNSLISVLQKMPLAEIEIFIICPDGNVIPNFENITLNVRKLKVKNIPSFFPSAEGVKFTAIRSFFGLIKNYRGINEIVDYIEEVQPDIIHFNESILTPILRKLNTNKFKVVVHARSKPGNRRSILDILGDYYINNKSDVLLCINQSVLLGFKGVENKIILKNPLQFSDEKLNALRLQPSKTLEGATLNCLFLSNLFDFKGIVETIQSAIRLKNHDVHFYIAGSAPRSKEFFTKPLGKLLNFTGLYPDLESYINIAIENHGLKNVHVLGHVEDIEYFFDLCHINLAPMWLDAPPRSVFEAGAFGIPTILSLKIKTDDIINDGKNGLLIDPKNVDQLVEAILFLKQNPKVYSNMSKEIKKSSLTEHDPAIISHKLVKIYQDLVKLK